MKSVTLAVVLLMTGRAMAAAPTDAELNDFGRAMQAAVSTGDADAYAALWDINGLTDRITANVNAPAAVQKRFRVGLINGGLTKKFAAPLIQAVRKHGNFTFLGVRSVDGEKRVILRLNGDDGLNYQEMIVQRDAAGQPRAVDVYIYAAGDNMSTLQRRVYLQLALGGKGDFTQSTLLLERMLKAMKAGDFKSVIAEYDNADPEMRKEKLIQLTRLKAVMQSGDMALYQTAAADYAALFGDDAAGSLMSLDPLLNAKRYDDCLVAIDRIDKRVGGDPYLDFQRGRIVEQQGQAAKAALLYESALKRDPTLFEPADMLLTAALTAKDYPMAKKYLLHIERNRPEFRFGDLKNVELFAGFVASPQYAEWQNERPKETK